MEAAAALIDLVSADSIMSLRRGLWRPGDVGAIEKADGGHDCLCVMIPRKCYNGCAPTRCARCWRMKRDPMSRNDRTQNPSGQAGKPAAIYCFMDAVAKGAEEYAADHTTPMSDLLEEVEHFTLTRTAGQWQSSTPW